MMQNKRSPYVSPQVEMIQMESEGVIAGSGVNGGIGDIPNTDWAPKSSTRSYNTAGSSDLEDLIDDILTVTK